MERVETLAAEFRDKFVSFIMSCDQKEEAGLWDKEEYGEMEAFYQNDLFCVVLRLIASDGKISPEEADYIGETFGYFSVDNLERLRRGEGWTDGLKYTRDELMDTCNACLDYIQTHSYEEQFKENYDLLYSIDPAMADAYKELLGLLCDIIIESDGIVTEDEIAEANTLKQLVVG